MRWPSIIALALMFSSAPAVRAQTPSAPPTLEEARKAFQSGQFGTAAGDFQGIVTAKPGNARAWFNPDLSLREFKRYDPTVAAFEHAIGAD